MIPTRWSKQIIGRTLLTVVLSLLLTVALGFVDYFTGRELSVSAFYLMPICMAAWFAGRTVGYWMSFVCAATWLITDMASGNTYQQGLVAYWNTLMLMAFFFVVVFLLVAFRDSHDFLEETVQRRTAALQAEIAERKRLEAAKLQAERLAVVGRMAAEVAHEVRNPLGSIALNLDLISKEVDALADTSRYPPDESRVLVNEMREEVRRIQHVLEDYLQFARMPKPQRRLVVLNDLLRQKLAFMQGLFEQARVKLQTVFAATPTKVSADAEQLWQAMLNLLRNSLEAMPDGGDITVSTRQEGNQALLQVSDTGKGMTEELLKQVFAPFFTTKTGGTGLGLALVQQIVTEHGGHVECESAFGKGSTFTIFLPLEENL